MLQQSGNVQSIQVNKPPDVIMGHHSETAETIYKPTLLANCIILQLQVNGIRYAKELTSTIQGISKITWEGGVREGRQG
jgi:hypothetical protein